MDFLISIQNFLDFFLLQSTKRLVNNKETYCLIRDLCQEQDGLQGAQEVCCWWHEDFQLDLLLIWTQDGVSAFGLSMNPTASSSSRLCP